MVIVLEGDLLESDCTTIMHQANCFKSMKAGIAKSIAKMYPESEEADNNFKLSSQNRFGNFSLATAVNGVSIVNLYGQFNMGRGLQTDYDKLELAIGKFLSYAKNNIVKADLTKVGVPYNIGCGLAGGDWETVEEILIRQSNIHEVNIYVYKL